MRTVVILLCAVVMQMFALFNAFHSGRMLSLYRAMSRDGHSSYMCMQVFKELRFALFMVLMGEISSLAMFMFLVLRE